MLSSVTGQLGGKEIFGDLGTTRVSVVSVCWRWVEWEAVRPGGVVWCGNIFSRSWSSSPLLSSFIWGQGMLKSVLSVKGIKGFRRVGLALFFVRVRQQQKAALWRWIDEEKKDAVCRSCVGRVVGG